MKFLTLIAIFAFAKVKDVFKFIILFCVFKFMKKSTTIFSSCFSNEFCICARFVEFLWFINCDFFFLNRFAQVYQLKTNGKHGTIQLLYKFVILCSRRMVRLKFITNHFYFINSYSKRNMLTGTVTLWVFFLRSSFSIPFIK